MSVMMLEDWRLAKTEQVHPQCMAGLMEPMHPKPKYGLETNQQEAEVGMHLAIVEYLGLVQMVV